MTAVIPPVSKLSSRIIRILGCNPNLMTLQGTNTYILGTGKRRVLLDTGDADVPQYIHHLRSCMQNEGIDLEHIIITHWHHDHIGGVKSVLESVARECTVWKLQRRESDDILPNIPIKYLSNGQEINIEGASLRIVHTPGHTTDHIVVCLKEENALFSGDCILGEGTAVFEDLHDYMQSLHKILELKPVVIYPGHGPLIEDPVPKIQYYIEHRKKREEQILNVLHNEPNRTFSEIEIVKIIYKDTPEHLHMAAAINVNHHLKKLHKEHQVVQQGDCWSMNKNHSSSL